MSSVQRVYAEPVEVGRNFVILSTLGTKFVFSTNYEEASRASA